MHVHVYVQGILGSLFMVQHIVAPGVYLAVDLCQQKDHILNATLSYYLRVQESSLHYWKEQV